MSMIARTWNAAWILLLAGAIPCAGAHAASLDVEVNASYDIFADADRHDFDSVQYADHVGDASRPAGEARHVLHSLDDAIAILDVSGQSEFGHLSAFASAQSGIGSAALSATASASARSAFQDTLTIESASLLAGSPVTVRFSGYSHFLSNRPESVGSTGSLNADFVIGGSGGKEMHFQTLFPPSNPEFSAGDYFDMQTEVGAQIPISGALAVAAAAISNSFGAEGTSNFMWLDANSTAYLTIDVRTPGATYTAESGAKYLTNLPVPVPLPAGLPLLAGALTALGLLARNRKAGAGQSAPGSANSTFPIA